MAKLSFWKKADIILLLCAATVIAAPAQTFTSLHSFNNTDGGSPTAALIEGNDGNIYGTTTGGGSSGQGTVFKIDQAGALTTLYTFCTTPQSGYRSSVPTSSSLLIDCQIQCDYSDSVAGLSPTTGIVFS